MDTSYLSAYLLRLLKLVHDHVGLAVPRSYGVMMFRQWLLHVWRPFSFSASSVRASTTGTGAKL